MNTFKLSTRNALRTLLNPALNELLADGLTPTYYKLCRILEFARIVLGVN